MRSIETIEESRRTIQIRADSFVSLTNGVIFKVSSDVIANVIVKIRRA